MRGLFIWANSYCRSTLAFYRGLGLAFDVPLKIVVLKGLSEARQKTGFCVSEFNDLDICMYEGLEASVKLFQKYNKYYHIFGAYQLDESRKLIHLAIQHGIRFGIASEAPCNMDAFPRRLLKYLFIRFVLPRRVKEVTKNADFIINYSGKNTQDLVRIGWNPEKVIPCGYFSPAIEGSQILHREKNHWSNFTIMLSGIHQCHRSPMVLLKALKELDKRGVKYECNITQKGPLFEEMKKFIANNNLTHAHLLGFLDMKDLIYLYENCSVYVGAGNDEPWGMRLNDALQCGSPMIINRGMGGCKLVDDYNCGLTFNRNNHIELANAIQKMVEDYHFYQECADAAYKAASDIKPEKKALDIVSKIKNVSSYL